MLKLYLFGPPRVEIEGVPVAIRRRKALALLVYLAVNARPHSRDLLATLFYADLSQSRARAYFRRDLGALNQHQLGDWIQANRDTVTFQSDPRVWIDVSHFRSELEACRKEHPAEEEAKLGCLALTADLYKDHFMAGFSLPDCPAFDEWQFFESENLRRSYAGLLEEITAGYTALKAYEQALPFAQLLVGLDPLNESAQRSLMEIYTMTGQQSAALRQYEVLVKLLQEELHVQAEAETQKLIENIKTRRLAPGNRGDLIPAIDIFPAEAQEPEFLTADDPPNSLELPFVARDHEIKMLQNALEMSVNGQGQVQFVLGGAGWGKSTLLKEFSRRALENHPNLIVVSGYCHAITGVGDPYLPFREAILMLTGDVESRWAGGLISGEHARRLWDLIPTSLPILVKHGPDLVNSLVPGGALLERSASWAKSGSDWYSALSSLNEKGLRAGLEQMQIFSEYIAVLKAVAEQQPLMLVLEDLHWADPASIGLLFHLSREIAGSRILVVGTCRPEEIQVSGSGNSLSDIISELKRQFGDIWIDVEELFRTKGRQFIDAFLDTQPNRLGESFRELFFHRTGGNALFTAELLENMQGRGELLQDENGRWVENGEVDWSSLPARVEGLIEKRFERLPENLREILTVASVEGETFTAEVVSQVQLVETHHLVQQLSRELDKKHQLVSAQGMEWLEIGRQRLSIYRFRHHLYQVYLYNLLDEVERSYLHEAVGLALESLYDGKTEAITTQLAWHFEQAGFFLKSIQYLQQAGNLAAAVSGHEEAISHFQHALELSKKVELDSNTLAGMYINLGQLFLVTKGDGAPEVGKAYRQAFDLFQEEEVSSKRFEALRGLAMYHRHRRETSIANQYSEQLKDLGHRLGDPFKVVEALFALGSLHLIRGEFVQAQKYLEQSINSYDFESFQSLQAVYDQDPGVTSFCYAALASWFLGYPDRAQNLCRQALSLAKKLAHPYSLIMAMIWNGWVNLYSLNHTAVDHWVSEATQLLKNHEFPLFQAVCRILKGWVKIKEGDRKAGINLLKKGLKHLAIANGTEHAPVSLMVLLAEAYLFADRLDEGFQIISLAHEQLKEDLEYGEGETYRVEGELLLAAEKNEGDAEKKFRKAIEIAKRQGSLSLELRAGLRLSRLWLRQDKKSAALEILERIYSKFTEGFDTPDLIEAEELLKELGGNQHAIT